MLKRPFVPLLALPLLLGVAACDDSDYEDQIAELQEQLDAATSQASDALTENEDLNAQLEDLNDQLSSVQAIGEDALESARSGLSEAASSAQTALDRLDLVGEGGLEQTTTETVAALREDLSQMVERIETAANDLGLQLDTSGANEEEGAGSGN